MTRRSLVVESPTMDFELEETQRMVQESARDYAARAIAPRARTIDRDAKIPRELLQGLAELGLLGVNVPEDLGGAGAGAVAYSLAMTEIAKACASTAVTMAVTNMVAEVITKFGNASQRNKYVPRL